jgi:DNA-binding transcriptional regulator/RsmH inhibitor MraZ
MTVAGNFDHLEIWDKETFDQRDAAGQASIAGGEGINDFL